MEKNKESLAEALPKEQERVVICRTCDGKGKHTPEYGEAIALIQATWDAGNIDSLIDESIRYMQVKHSRRKHVRKLLETFCRIAERFDGI